MSEHWCHVYEPPPRDEDIAPQQRPIRPLVGYRALLAIVCGALTLDAGGLVLTWDAADWHSLPLLVVLVGFAIAAELGAVAFRGMVVSNSFLAIILAAAALGPGPAVVVGLSTVIVDVILRRRGVMPLLANATVFITYPMLCGVAIQALAPDAGESPARLAFVVLAVGGASGALNFGLVSVIRRLNPGHSIRDGFRDVFMPTVPYQIVGATLAVAAVHANATYGLSLMAVVVTVCLVSELLLRSVTAAHIRADDVVRLTRQRTELLEEALRIEETERARLAQHLHDQTLQLLAGAQQDLSDGDAGRASEQIAGAVAELRTTLVHLHPVSVAMHGLGAALEAYAEQLARRAGIEIVVAVEDAPQAGSDALLYSIGRELLGNAARHARATRVQLTVVSTPETRVLRVSDDGSGFDECSDPDPGHVGLASARQRTEAAGGTLTVRSGPGLGTTVAADVPLRASVLATTGGGLGGPGDRLRHREAVDAVEAHAVRGRRDLEA